MTSHLKPKPNPEGPSLLMPQVPPRVVWPIQSDGQPQAECMKLDPHAQPRPVQVKWSDPGDDLSLYSMDREEAPTVEWPPRGNVAKWAGIARMGGVGDNLIAASVLGPLKRAGYKIEVITQDPYHVVFENNPNIDKLSVKTKDDFPQGDMLAWQFWFANRGKEYARFANLSHSCEHLVAHFPAQTSFWWPAHMRRKLSNRSYIEAVHDIFAVSYEFGPLFHPTDEERAQALETKKNIGERCLAWCISGSRIDKVYPLAAYAIARIIKELDIPVVLIGAPNEKDKSCAALVEREVEKTNGSKSGFKVAISESMDRQNWPIRRVLSLALASDLVIGPDTGPMWAAAFEPMPKILMLSHASPENISKHWINTTTLHADQARVPCWPCHQLHDTPSTCTPNKEKNGAACMSDISVERLLTTIEKVWRQAHG